MKPILWTLALAAACTPAPTMIDIPGASFKMSSTEVTNAQFEAFAPSHKHLRGYKGFSLNDDEAVVMVSWDDAVAYCDWLARRIGRNFRLPTQAEWEYACRAGSTSAYNTGDNFPSEQWKVQENTRDKVPVSLQVASFAPNAWGLFDMHGNVEEWCLDRIGDYRAVRGGSHNTPVEFLRSDAVSASIPEDRSVLLGFRVVEASEIPAPCTNQAESVHRLPETGLPCTDQALSVHGPFFAQPLPYVIAPVDGSPFYAHNHQPAVCCLPDGRLLAIWFSTDAEAGREMVVLQSIFDGKAWSPASLFCKVPGRNMTGSALLSLDSGEILHFQGVGDAGEWKDLALSMRRLSGGNWSALKYIEPEHEVRHQVIAGPIVTRDGRILLCCDAGPGGEDGTSLHVSNDGGESWEDTGSTIAGIHAGIVELADGSLMAYGRGNSIEGKMPRSISRDGGRSWEYSPTTFPPIGSGQRLVLKRLQEGPLMLCSFGENGLFLALSEDEGVSWPVQKLISDGKTRVLDGGAWTGKFTMDATHAEPRGYLACTQGPDGTIHLLSSRVHYRFNLDWIRK